VLSPDNTVKTKLDFPRSQRPRWECILEFNLLKNLFSKTTPIVRTEAGASVREEDTKRGKNEHSNSRSRSSR